MRNIVLDTGFSRIFNVLHNIYVFLQIIYIHVIFLIKILRLPGCGGQILYPFIVEEFLERRQGKGSTYWRSLLVMGLNSE